MDSNSIGGTNFFKADFATGGNSHAESNYPDSGHRDLPVYNYGVRNVAMTMEINITI